MLKKTDVFDIEGVLQRIDTIEQLPAQLEQAQEQISNLQGDIQTRERELFHSNMRLAVNQEQMKARESALEQRKATELYNARLGDTLRNAGDAAATEIQRIGMEERDRLRRQTSNKQEQK